MDRYIDMQTAVIVPTGSPLRELILRYPLSVLGLSAPRVDETQFAATNSDFEVITKAWTFHSSLLSGIPGARVRTKSRRLRPCPNLRELCLPYLDILHDDPTQLSAPTTLDKAHPLIYLRVDDGQWKGGRVELCYEKYQDRDYATYLLRLFPNLDRPECCRYVAGKGKRWGDAGWGRVFKWLCDKKSLDKVYHEQRRAERPRPRDVGLWDGARICRPPWSWRSVA